MKRGQDSDLAKETRVEDSVSDADGKSFADGEISSRSASTAPASQTPHQRGVFLDFYVPHEGIKKNDQARRILSMVEKCVEQGFTKVGIIYSASQQQTKDIRATYESDEWYTKTKGSHQAAVMAEVERLLQTSQYKHLQNVFRILPITTCQHEDETGEARSEWITENFFYIESFLTEKDNLVLGWYNTQPVSGQPVQYAINSNVLTPEQSNQIQEQLQKLSQQRDSRLESLMEMRDALSIGTVASKPEVPQYAKNFGVVSTSLLAGSVATASSATLLGVTASAAGKLALVFVLCQAVPFGGQIALAAACGLLALAGIGYLAYQARKSVLSAGGANQFFARKPSGYDQPVMVESPRSQAS